MQLQGLYDRVSELELAFERLVRKEKKIDESKYTWTAEIESPEVNRTYKGTAEIKGKGEYPPIERTYTVKVCDGRASEKKNKKEEKVKDKGKSVNSTSRIVEIEEPSDNGGIVLRQVFAKSLEKKKGFACTSEAGIAKVKLKEVRALFNNFSYRRYLSRDKEKRQRFSEKIIVLLLTVDAIEGADLMVRATKKAMVDELEVMFDWWTLNLQENLRPCRELSICLMV